ncbi:hypothetical protein KIPB_013430, partial [Kipferlia bialata]|eukprot:g13430.t1
MNGDIPGWGREYGGPPIELGSGNVSEGVTPGIDASMTANPSAPALPLGHVPVPTGYEPPFDTRGFDYAPPPYPGMGDPLSSGIIDPIGIDPLHSVMGATPQGTGTDGHGYPSIYIPAPPFGGLAPPSSTETGGYMHAQDPASLGGGQIPPITTIPHPHPTGPSPAPEGSVSTHTPSAVGGTTTKAPTAQSKSPLARPMPVKRHAPSSTDTDRGGRGDTQ